MATERGLGQRTNINKLGWEESSFPIVCETCLGDNPYVRMMKDRFGAECKICQRPFTVFRWKAGTKGRFKRTEICQTCAKLKNVCQTCIFDLQYGLPVEVRDKFLDSKQITFPVQAENREYWLKQANENIDQLALPYEKEELNPLLATISRLEPYYDRNKPKTCTFWLKGTCNRGDLCPYLHEKREFDPDLEDQNIKDRFHGKQDPVAQKIFQKVAETDAGLPGPAPKSSENEQETRKAQKRQRKRDARKVIQQQGN